MSLLSAWHLNVALSACNDNLPTHISMGIGSTHKEPRKGQDSMSEKINHDLPPDYPKPAAMFGGR